MFSELFPELPLSISLFWSSKGQPHSKISSKLNYWYILLYFLQKYLFLYSWSNLLYFLQKIFVPASVKWTPSLHKCLHKILSFEAKWNQFSLHFLLTVSFNWLIVRCTIKWGKMGEVSSAVFSKTVKKLPWCGHLWVKFLI